ncbi:MAG: restriction endonuclease, SacI family [Thermomicrobiales bacterium]
MGITLDQHFARTRLEEAIVWAQSDREVPEEWLRRSLLVGEAPSITYTPMLGTGLLARATDNRVDALALKKTSDQATYSARGLCHNVLVPSSVTYGFDIRTTGREPLNNQPFFRYDRVDQADRVRFPEHHRYLVDCLETANRLPTDEAMAALAAYVRVCFERADANTVESLKGVAVGLHATVTAAKILLSEDNEGGKRAQALVAAVLDVVYGVDRVKSRLVNDPSRDFPGDVQGLDGSGRPIISVEVRTKPMPQTEIEQFAHALSEAGITRAMAVVLASNQPTFARAKLAERLAVDYGVLMTVIDNVDDLLLAAFAWSTKPLPEVLDNFPGQVSLQLKAIGAAQTTIEMWTKLVEG